MFSQIFNIFYEGKQTTKKNVSACFFFFIIYIKLSAVVQFVVQDAQQIKTKQTLFIEIFKILLLLLITI
jgi:hypothetical protein